MADSSTQSIVIDARPEQVASVITDFASYPAWVSAVKQVAVLEEHPSGRARRVEFTMDAGVLKDTYTLEYSYADDLSRIEWTLAEPSQVQKAQQGSYDLRPNPDGGCTVTYTLAVELTIPMLGMFRRKAEKMIMDTALTELKKQVEATA